MEDVRNNRRYYPVIGEGAHKPANAQTALGPEEFPLFLALTDASSKYPIEVTAHVGCNVILRKANLPHGFY